MSLKRHEAAEAANDVAAALYLLAGRRLATPEAWDVEACDLAEKVADGLASGVETREAQAVRIGWLEQGIRLADKDLERVAQFLNTRPADREAIAREVERIAEQLRKTIEGPEAP